MVGRAANGCLVATRRLFDNPRLLSQHLWSNLALPSLLVWTRYLNAGGPNPEASYARSENASPDAFWFAMALVVFLGCSTLKQTRSDVGPFPAESDGRVEGWMQCVFIMYHYYRARFLYNEVRVSCLAMFG